MLAGGPNTRIGQDSLGYLNSYSFGCISALLKYRGNHTRGQGPRLRSIRSRPPVPVLANFIQLDHTGHENRDLHAAVTLR